MVGADRRAVPGLSKLPCCFRANAGGPRDQICLRYLRPKSVSVRPHAIGAGKRWRSEGCEDICD
jgi:hypothetical protein